MPQVNNNDPSAYVQQNKYLPHFTFLGYSQAQPLDVNATINPAALEGTIQGLNQDYNKGFEADQGRIDNYYKALMTAPGDIPDRNKYLQSFDQSSNSLLDKFRDDKGRVRYESSEFMREMRSMNRQFATDPALEQFRQSLEGFNYWKESNQKAPNGLIDFNPYVDANGRAYNTLQNKAPYQPDFSPIPDVIKPVTDLWSIVKADATKTQTINDISGISTDKEYESNKPKIDALVDEVTASFLNTREGAIMFRQLTEPHRLNGSYFNPPSTDQKVNEEVAIRKIKEHIENLGELYKYEKSGDVKTTKPDWNDILLTKKKYLNAQGEGVEVVTLPKGNEVSYTVKGNSFASPEELNVSKEKWKKNVTEIRESFGKWNKGEGDIAKEVVDASGRPVFVLNNPNDKSLVNKYQKQLDEYSNIVQLEHNKTKYAEKFDYEAKKAAGLLDMGVVQKGDYQRKLDDIKKNFLRGVIGFTSLTKESDVQGAYHLMIENPDLFNRAVDVQSKSILQTINRDTLAEKDALIKEVDQYMTSRGYGHKDALNFKLMFDNNAEEVARMYQESENRFNEKLKDSKFDKRYLDYLSFYDTKGQDRIVSDSEFTFDTIGKEQSKQKDYRESLQRQIELNLMTGTHEVFMQIGNQDVPISKDDIDNLIVTGKDALSKDSKYLKNFQVKGWRFDNDNGIVVTAAMELDGEMRNIEVRNYKNLEDYLINQGYDVAYRLSQREQIAKGFRDSFDSESEVGSTRYNDKNEVIQKSYRVEKLLFPEGAYKEGTLKVDMDGEVHYMDSYNEVIEAYINHVAVQTQEKQPQTITDGTTTVVPRNSSNKVVAANYNNPYGVSATVNGVEGYVVYPTPEAGLQAASNDIRIKLNGTSGEMKRRFGDDYLSTATLYDLIATFAPSADGNNPDSYSEKVAKELGITKETLLNSIKDSTALAKAMLKIESPSTYKQLYGQG